VCALSLLCFEYDCGNYGHKHQTQFWAGPVDHPRLRKRGMFAAHYRDLTRCHTQPPGSKICNTEMHANARELNAVSCSCYSRFRQPSLFKPSLKRQVRRNLTAGQDILWVDPGDVASLDFARDSLNKHRISSQQRERLLAMGFRDKNQKEITSDITVEDVRWLPSILDGSQMNRLLMA
jgi:hypothetical protein